MYASRLLHNSVCIYKRLLFFLQCRITMRRAFYDVKEMKSEGKRCESGKEWLQTSRKRVSFLFLFGSLFAKIHVIKDIFDQFFSHVSYYSTESIPAKPFHVLGNDGYRVYKLILQFMNSFLALRDS